MEAKEYNDLKKEIGKLEKKVDTHNSKVGKQIDEIYDALVGNEKLGSIGLVKKVSLHEKWINEQKFKNAKLYGGMGVIGVLWTLLLKFWDKLV
tara:strand:+ start:129 stop:407 length:279 start_codon:yes stop_codon:yes gene_type:complete